ncbi:Maf family protein [Viridibacillus sp. YIM B01967]|uniref:Nucleoside triphosphate pyrophosphatase n=1 Tax=Viridibacillus soli TaxID=2798301 RepID=A0ABS1H2N6_9BACL|nr:Maf family protein [Viridibacillus soli]MBK3493437.1 Maf family protein [Viridibacillus soli]
MTLNPVTTIVLVSPRGNTEDIFSRIQVPYEVEYHHVAIDYPPTSSPLDLTIYCAFLTLLRQFKVDQQKVYISMKRTVSINDEILKPPTTRQAANRYLTKLSNREHIVTTAIAVRYLGQVTMLVVESKVKMKRLSQKIIEHYVETGEPFEHDIGYNVQGLGANLSQSIEGDFDNVAGLPINHLQEHLVNNNILIAKEGEIVDVY